VSSIPKSSFSQCCDNPRNIPTECEVELLIEIMEQSVNISLALAPQWIRASFHDAGTFNHEKQPPEGGANGCLLTHLPMRRQGENSGLDLALETLQTIKDLWEGHPETCLDVSAADMLQWAGWFSVFRQMDEPGLTDDKIKKLVQVFNWGRPDELNCNISWTANLPGFKLGTNETDIPQRCANAGGEIKDKMMDRNGFTAIEATALIGAHTLGLTRSVFGVGTPFVSKWDETGAENFTSKGGRFDNSFHFYLKNAIVANDTYAFANNSAPFTTIFGDWFRDDKTEIGHLDTDIVLAFPSTNTSVHPDFHTFTAAFANDSEFFMTQYFLAYDKMSSLGVTVNLSDAKSCSEGCGANKTKLVLTAGNKEFVKQDINEALDKADVQLNATVKLRASEIVKLTNPLDKSNIKKFNDGPKFKWDSQKFFSTFNKDRNTPFSESTKDINSFSSRFGVSFFSKFTQGDDDDDDASPTMVPTMRPTPSPGSTITQPTMEPTPSSTMVPTMMPTFWWDRGDNDDDR
jgi:hypothetical protein